MPNVFAVPVFFICFRESLETSIIVSVLLSFLKQTLDPQADAEVHKKLVRQVWWAVASGLLICIIIGAGIIGTFYTLGRNTFESAENIWEGIFAILASVIITLISAALLRISKLQDKWRRKIRLAIEAKENQTGMWKPGFWKRDNVKRLGEKYALFILPFVTVLREGIEAVLFIAGVGVGLPAESFPLAVICGLAAGIAVGYLIYRGGTSTSLQIFLIISTCFLYLIAAGLFSRGVWLFEQNAWVKLAGEGAAEAGAGPGSYDIRKSVWHVNCCSPLENGSGGWGIFNSLFGWQNSATYGSVISYNIYWLVVIIGFLFLGIREKKYGVKTSATEAAHAGEKGVGHGTGNGFREDESETSSAHKEIRESKLKAGGKAGVNTRGATATEVREV